MTGKEAERVANVHDAVRDIGIDLLKQSSDRLLLIVRGLATMTAKQLLELQLTERKSPSTPDYTHLVKPTGCPDPTSTGMSRAVSLIFAEKAPGMSESRLKLLIPVHDKFRTASSEDIESIKSSPVVFAEKQQRRGSDLRVVGRYMFSDVVTVYPTPFPPTDTVGPWGAPLQGRVVPLSSIAEIAEIMVDNENRWKLMPESTMLADGNIIQN